MFFTLDSEYLGINEKNMVMIAVCMEQAVVRIKRDV